MIIRWHLLEGTLYIFLTGNQLLGLTSCLEEVEHVLFGAVIIIVAIGCFVALGGVVFFGHLLQVYQICGLLPLYHLEIRVVGVDDLSGAPECW